MPKKHIVVLGAGIIGTTTAYYLAEQGYKVTVIDRRHAVAQESSFANGAQLCYSCIQPLYLDNNGIAIATINEELTKMRNALFKQASNEFVRLRQKMHGDFSYNNEGILQLFFDSQTFDAAKDLAKYKVQQGVALTILSAAECIDKESSLQNSNNICGGILMQHDGIGDAFAFTKIIYAACQNIGVEFKFGKEIYSDEIINNSFKSDAYVVCLGVQSKEFLAPLGINLNMKYVKGYSISIALNSKDVVPSIGVADPAHDVFYAKLGNYLRVAGLIEEVNNTEITNSQIAVLMNATNNLFPSLKVFDKENNGQITKWACVRPSSVTKVPFISSTKYKNIFINTGHGGYGWTLAAVSAKEVTDLVMESVN